MSFGSLIFLSAILSAVGTYVDKKIIDKGISKQNYFYFMCLTMIPFAIISIVIELLTNNYKFNINILTVILLICAMFLRFIKQKSFVGCYRHLQPYEFKTYMSITIVICFAIDILFGIQSFTILKGISILFIIMGVFLIYNVKINIKIFKKDLIIRIISDVILGYIIYNIFKYWSNGMYILLLNLMLVILFTPIYKPYKKENSQINLLALILLQQTFGFAYTYIYNYLSSNSVTLSSFVSPISLVLITVIAFFVNKYKKPNMKNVFGIVLSIIGICLLNVF